ncbi:MAG: response regulator transcription factor [Treponemataceae bacterium]|nr:response regulator transcription factor [Spirochaetales bacterium]MDY6030831.1 response regulator transcription factor [Treponemataceae bacterium]
MKANILIIEDVKELSDLVAMYLTKEGMTVHQCETAELAIEELKSFSPDLVYLDLNLPGMDGFEFLNNFRKNHATPVIIVSARDADEDIIMGLGYGADEFVTKPFSPRVLTARIRAILRRQNDNAQNSESENTKSNVVKFGPYILDFESYLLKTTEGKRIMLSAKEFAVLEYLTKNPDKPISPDEIYREVWENAYGDISAVAVYIQRLRKKIEEDPNEPRFIETVFGLGYRFNLNDREALFKAGGAR